MNSSILLDTADHASFPADDRLGEVAQQSKRKVLTASNSDFPMVHEMWFSSLDTKLDCITCTNKKTYF